MSLFEKTLFVEVGRTDQFAHAEVIEDGLKVLAVAVDEDVALLVGFDGETATEKGDKEVVLGTRDLDVGSDEGVAHQRRVPRDELSPSHIQLHYPR